MGTPARKLRKSPRG